MSDAQPIEIRADGVDGATVAADLAARAAARPPLAIPEARLDLPPPLPDDPSAQLTAWLDRARRVATRLSVDPRVGWHTPVLGRLWNVGRRLLYRDLRLYADAVASKQMVYNEALVRTVELLVARVAELEAARARDEADGRAARKRLAALVARLEERQAAIEEALAARRRPRRPRSDE